MKLDFIRDMNGKQNRITSNDMIIENITRTHIVVSKMAINCANQYTFAYFIDFVTSKITFDLMPLTNGDPELILSVDPFTIIQNMVQSGTNRDRIYPAFTPEYTITVKNPYKKDILKRYLNACNMNDTFKSGYNDVAVFKFYHYVVEYVVSQVNTSIIYKDREHTSSIINIRILNKWFQNRNDCNMLCG